MQRRDGEALDQIAREQRDVLVHAGPLERRQVRISRFPVSRVLRLPKSRVLRIGADLEGAGPK